MLVSKSFLVIGHKINRDGMSHSTICEEVDKVLNAFYAENKGEVTNIESNMHMGGLAGQDMVFLNLTVKKPDPITAPTADLRPEAIEPVVKKRK